MTAATVVPTGKRVPDLVLVLDSEPGRKPELRVQCEIELSAAEADEVYTALYDPNSNKDVTKAHKKIKTKLSWQSPEFQAMVNLAFKGNGSTEP